MPRVSAAKAAQAQEPTASQAPTINPSGTKATTAQKAREIDATEVQSKGAREMPASGAAMLTDLEIDIIQDGPKFASKAEELAFMDEAVEIIVHRGASKNPEPIVQLACNGRNQFILRNRRQTVKRRYIEVLCNAREITYLQEEYMAENGERRIRNIPQHGLRYPFTVTRDTDRGAAWLEKKLAEVY